MISDNERLLDNAIHALDPGDRINARVKILDALNERERLRQALREILAETEFVGDAKQPFSTWIAEKCRTALNSEKGGE